MNAKNTVKTVAMFVALSAFFTSASAALPKISCALYYKGYNVVVFEHADKKGKLWRINSFDEDLGARGMGAKVSSICVSKGKRVTIYEHTNYGGASKSLGEGFHNLTGWWNDRIYSIKVH